MKKRTAKHLEKERFSMRNFNKLIYLTFSIQEYWSLRVKNTCYVRTKDGRVLIYSKRIKIGNKTESIKGKGYYLWNEEEESYETEYFD